MPVTSYDAKLDRLLATAAKVFADKGFHPTTMRDLSRATGMSLAGMYYYVRGKDDLLYRIQERTFSRVLEGGGLAVAQGRDPLERLHRFIRHHVTFFAEHMPEMKVLSHEAESLGGKRREAINALKRRYVDLLLGVLREIDGLEDAADRRLAAYALFGMMNWIYTWYDPEGPISPERLAERFAELFLYGAVPSPAATRSDA